MAGGETGRAAAAGSVAPAILVVQADALMAAATALFAVGLMWLSLWDSISVWFSAKARRADVVILLTRGLCD